MRRILNDRGEVVDQRAVDVERLPAVPRNDSMGPGAVRLDSPLLIRTAVARPLDDRRGRIGGRARHIETLAACARHDLEISVRRCRVGVNTEDDAA